MQDQIRKKQSNSLWSDFHNQEMFSVNLFDFIIVIVSNISYTCSPIDKSRFEDESKILATKSKETRFTQIREPDWSVLLRPRELVRLIKRNHLCGNKFIIYLAILQLIFIHLTLKSVFYIIIWSIGNEETLNYFDGESYYPALFSTFPNPRAMQNFIVSATVCAFVIRIVKTCELIRNSIVNADHYREINISQMNLADLKNFKLSIEEWKRLLIYSFKHPKKRQNDVRVREAHTQIIKWYPQKLSEMSRRDIIYRFNMITFTNCYESLNLPIRGSSRKWRKWYCSTPAYRSDVDMIRNILIWAIIASALVCIIALLFLFGAVYYELRSSLPSDLHPSTSEVFSNLLNHLSNPRYCIRLVELFCIIFCQVPHNFDAAMLYFDMMFLISRIEKVVQCLKRELGFCEKRMNVSQFINVGSPYMSLWPLEFSLKDKNDLNKRLEYDIKLAAIVYAKFLDLRKSHKTFINIIFISTAIVFSYILSLMFVVETVREKALLFIGCTTFSINAVLIMMLASIVELKFKRLNLVLNELMKNKWRLLDKKTIEMLISMSPQIHKKADRSVSIAGHYQITKTSIAPFFTYMATAIVLIDRFMRKN